MQEVTSIRIDAALIPSEPQASAVIAASQEITQRFDNRNVIDRQRFPPHLSLHIATIPAHKVLEFLDIVANATEALDRTPMLIPEELEEGTAGYVSLRISITPEVNALHRAVIDATASVRQSEDPELSPRVTRYAPEDQDRYRKYGSIYVLERFDAHFSIAKVNWEDQADALAIAERHLADVAPCPAEAMVVCDIGPHSEKWEVLSRL
jgi:hypothetical protein